ncbi:nucleolar protein 6 isoform X2 [Dioscorea cayenensis subsp. rotundata]|uniref:Nucleolar protein 6 isoform X2 n=1 Tax=Dioscorea cayennensis subsp. rotundata TaxID=55577 RepID=A0AB40BMY5_DIOCR|nr:nucleolar protein 6 isoform X2 [Dioscorea cayenensis subsp. rotundata]
MIMEANSMDFKVGELLKEVRIDSAASKTLDKAVSSIVDAIKAIPERVVSSKGAQKFIEDLRVPAKKARFTFKSPESVIVAGSHSIRSIARPDINVDLLVRMPKECFHRNDYLNHRYHAKRCLYLRVIAKSLKSSPLVQKVRWSTFQNEARKPVLILSLVPELSELHGCYIRIIPTASSIFDTSRLSLEKNNVREVSQDGISQPTPRYNSSILEDMFLEDNAEFVKKMFLEWSSLEEALVLVKVWARNRSSIYMHDCLNGHLISVIVAYLATRSGGNCINKSMNAMQIFRITLKFIGTSSAWDRCLSLQPLGQYNLSQEDLKQYLQTFGVVLLDASGCLNLTFRLKRAAFSELQDEAVRTLKCIEKYGDGGFEEIFMTKVDFAAKFDSFLRINLKDCSRLYMPGFCLDDECWRTSEDKLHSLLKQGLNDRVKLIRVTWKNAPFEWNIEDGLSKFSDEPMLVGMLNSTQEKSFRVVDVGPSPEDKEEAIKFRKFWGERAELRRFKDGTIAESTVWDCESWERHLIIKRITEYILWKHFLLPKEDIIHTADQLDFCLHLDGKDSASFSGSLLGAFETLSKRLRNIKEIPLKISSVQPLDPALRHTSVYPPPPHPLAFENSVSQKPPKFATTCIHSLEVMIQLEGSGNWPLDNIAIEKTKAAFLLKIGESLQDKWGVICDATDDEVNVLMSGHAFRLKILHERGVNLLKNQETNKMKSTSLIDKELFLRSQHSSMINGLHGRYPTYGPVVRLAKRWVSSHLFSSFLTEEAIELVVAYLFLNPFPFLAPSSRITGFLRFLRLLSDYDWTFSPMIIDINEDFTSDDLKEINEIIRRKCSRGRACYVPGYGI